MYKSYKRVEYAKTAETGLEQEVENLEVWKWRKYLSCTILSCPMYLGLLPEVGLSNISGELVLQKCAEYSRVTSTVDGGSLI